MSRSRRLFTLLVFCVAAAADAFSQQTLIISEFRLQGPLGSNDEFVEIYNNSGSEIIVNAQDGSSGFGLAASDGIMRFVIPNGTVIPNRGHYLGANSDYSLDHYPGAGTTTAPNVTYANDIPANSGIALFNSSSRGGLTAENLLDAVGPESEVDALYKEGNGYPDGTGSQSDGTLVRKLSCAAVTIHTTSLPVGRAGYLYLTTISATDGFAAGLPIDTGDNASDFRALDTGGILGAPGPENLSSPLLRADLVAVSLADPGSSWSSAPNLQRDYSSDPPNNSTWGTWAIRRKITNNTGSAITRLRFRVDNISTYPAASGASDLRVRSSTPVSISVSSPGPPHNVIAEATTLEEPPSQAAGGAFNSSVSVPSISLGTPLANGASVYVNILAGIEQIGDGHLHFVVEALP